MLNQYFKEKSAFLYNYFSNLIELVKENKKKFPQAIIFEGNDTKLQYLFSLELARLMNCKENQEDNCNCTNCKWIKSFQHPAIKNISQIHSKPENDDSKTVISVKQAKEIEAEINISSDYHRFFIFFSSKEYTYNEFDLIEFQNLGYSTEINYSIEPLEYSTFNINSINALLKSVEEPTENVTFIFLTKSRANILPTIVSRCQIFSLNSEVKKLDYKGILDIISIYPEIKSTNAFDLSQEFLNYSKDNQISIQTLLNTFIEYLKELIIKNPSSTAKIMNDIKIINHAIKMTDGRVDSKIALDTMFLRIARGY